MKKKGLWKVIVLSLVVCKLVACGGHYKYCIESAHYDAGMESKSLGKENNKGN